MKFARQKRMADIPVFGRTRSELVGYIRTVELMVNNDFQSPRQLVHELSDIKALFPGVAAFDVSVTGGGLDRDDAESHQLAGFGEHLCLPDSVAKGRFIRNFMICRQHQQYRVIVLLQGLDSGHRYCRCSVSAKWFEDDGQFLEADLACLFGDDEAVFIVADDDRRAVFEAIES